MNDLLRAFGQQVPGGSESFTPRAGYFSAMDCLIYLSEDISYQAVRLSPWITVLVDPARDCAVGVKIKGFRFVVEQLRAILVPIAKDLGIQVSEPDYVALISILEVAFTASLGEQATTEAENERRKRWADQVRNLARNAEPISFAELSALELAEAA